LSISRKALVLRIKKELIEMSRCYHGGKIHEAAGRLGIDESSLIDFSVSLNPYLTLDPRDAVRQAYGSIFSYPDNRYEKFRNSAARFAGVGADNIIPGNGSMEIIRLIAGAVLEKGDIVSIPCPTFGEYERECRLFGAGIRRLPWDDVIDNRLSGLDGSRMAFFCNPNNPDGRMILMPGMERIIKYCGERDILAVVDEAFIDLAGPAQSVASLVEKYDNLFVMRSLTKCFAIPGIRLGFGIAGKAAAGILDSARLTWNLDSIAADVGAYYMDNAGPSLGASRAYIEKERKWLTDRLGLIKGISPQLSSANYFIADVSGTGMTAGDIAEKLLKECILVRDCTSFGLPYHIRLAVKAREDNERLVEAMVKAAGARN
jgi:threonine-phosphate decarboxylase